MSNGEDECVRTALASLDLWRGRMGGNRGFPEYRVSWNKGSQEMETVPQKV